MTLGWRTPFEVYFGRKNNCLAFAETQKTQFRKENENARVRVTPDATVYKKFEAARQSLRQAASKATDRVAMRMINREMRRYPPCIYSRGENILVRLRHGRHHEPTNTKHHTKWFPVL